MVAISAAAAGGGFGRVDGGGSAGGDSDGGGGCAASTATIRHTNSSVAFGIGGLRVSSKDALQQPPT